MMSRSPGRIAAMAAVLVGGLAVGASPALGAPASGSTLLVQAIPMLKGVQVILDGRTYLTGAHGYIQISTFAGPHQVGVLPPRSVPAHTRVRFSRWLDGTAMTTRGITLGPGKNFEQVGFVISHPIAVKFTDVNGQRVPFSRITRITIASSLGRRFTFPPAHPPKMIQSNRVVRGQRGLQPPPIRYSVSSVIIDGANVVYGGSQNFFVSRSRIWTVKVLLFPLRIKVRDALFGFPIGHVVRLMLPNGSSRFVDLRAGHDTTLTRMPRTTYELVAEGPGFGLSSPVALSKPQTAKLLLLSWVDIAAVAAFAVLFLLGLPLAGGRIVRRSGRVRLVWHPGRPGDPLQDGSETPIEAGTAAHARSRGSQGTPTALLVNNKPAGWVAKKWRKT